MLMFKRKPKEEETGLKLRRPRRAIDHVYVEGNQGRREDDRDPSWFDLPHLRMPAG